MAIKITCACGKKLSVKDQFAGRTVKCPACQNPLSVPVPQAEDAASDGDWVSANDVAEGDESDHEFHELLASHNEPESAASSKHGSKRSAGNRSSASSSGASELKAVQASKVRAGISCYFFGFLLIIIAGCYLAVTPTLHQGDFITILRVIRGAGYVNLLTEIVTVIGLVLCLTVPKAMTRRNVLFVGVLTGLLGVLISGAALWSPLFSLRVGRWLPQIVMITTQLSFLLFVRWLGVFLRHPEITRQATRVLVCFGLYFAVWLVPFGAQIPMPNMVARGGMGGLVVMAAMLIVWIAAGILGFFGLLRLLSNCRAALRIDESSSKRDGERDEAAGAAWFSRSDVLKLGVGSAVVVLSFWGWFFVRQPAAVMFPFPVAAPGGRTAVVTPGKTTLLLVGHQGLVSNVAFSPDWTRIATASWDKTIKVWDATSGKELLTLSKHSDQVRRVVFSPDGKRLASASADKTVKIWDSDSGAELRTLATHATGIWTVAFSADGQRLASASDDKIIKVWNAATGQDQLTLKGHAGAITSMAFSPDGRWLVSADNDVKVWDATTGNEVRTLKGHKTMIASMAFRADGKQLATASYDSTVKLWDTTKWQESHSLLGHTGAVMSLAYRPDGKRLASTGVGMKVKEWDSATGQLCRTLPTMSPGNLSYSPDGKRLATANGFGNVEILDNPADQPVLLTSSPSPAANQKNVAAVGAQAPAQPQKAEAEEAPARPVATWNGWLKDAPAPAIAPFSAEQAKQHQEAWAKHLGVPVEFTNSIGMKFQFIPPGEFLMGSTPEEIRTSIAMAIPAGDTGWLRYAKSAGPQHKVILSRPFFLAVNEVTQGHYEKVMRTNPSYFAATGAGRAAVAGIDTTKHPVETVSWNDATEFCASLSKQEKLEPLSVRSGATVISRDGNGYRLPTEAEWEFACRAGTVTKYWAGDRVEDLALAGWFAANSRGNSNNGTHPVGELQANPFGLHDVHGNLFEWVQDWWEPTYYEQFQNQPALNPVAPASVDSQRTLRGGCYNWGAPLCGVAYRHGQPPVYRNASIGFRAALSVEGVKAALANPVQAEAPLVESRAKEPLTLKGHTAGVTSVTFSSDGKRLASASIDKSVKIWDASSGQVAHTLEGHTAGVTSVAFSSDGKRLASTSHDKTLKVWDVTSGQEMLTLKGHAWSVTSVAFSPDGKRLASVSYDRTMKLWDSTSGQEIPTQKGLMDGFYSVAFSSDGKRLASANVEKTVKVWDANSGQVTHTFSGHTGNVMSVAFSADGKWLASASMDQTVKVWNAASGQETRTLKGHSGYVTSVAFSADGKWLASAGLDGMVKVWDTASGQETLTLKVHTGNVHSVAFSPDGKRLASSGHDQTVKVSDVAVLSANPASQPASPQPAPPKPVAKDGREPIEYQPIRPDVWKAKNQSTWLFPWEGERIVLLTTTADLDPKTMAVFVKQLDAGWKLCSDLVGQSPRPFRVHNGKATIAAVPDNSFSGGGLVAYLGMTGIEVGGFYVPRGDYDQVRQNPEKFPDGFFFGIGQNHFVFANQCGVLSTGAIVALRHICAEAINGSDKDPQADQTIYRYEEAFAKSNATFQEAFTPFGATKPFVLNDLDGKPFGNIDLNVLIASTFLKLRKDNGGNEWTKRFFRHLATCPTTSGRDIDGAKGQLLNWVVAASLAAEKDLTPMFRDRWRFPLAPDLWQSLSRVDWNKSGLTADQVYDALPVDLLLPTVAMTRPGFLTPERRKQNLLVGGTFEGGSGGTWTTGSFRGNAVAAAVEGGVAKEGQKAVVIRAPIDDDARYLQKVAVKPNTRYLVSGWIKTKDVVVVEPTGRTGANLSIDAHTYELSQSVVGTNDWRYASFVFDSGTRTEVLVCARIGFVYSTAKGEAWFDDLVMIPLGASPPGLSVPPTMSARESRTGGLDTGDPGKVVSRTVPEAEIAVAAEAAKTARPLTNGDFKRGLEGWEIEGGAKEFQTVTVEKETSLTTYGRNRDADTGRLYQCFQVPADATDLQFSIHGGSDLQTLRLALWNGPQLYRHTAARDDHLLFQYRWNVVPLRGKVVTLEIGDNSTAAWGCIGVQGISLISQKPGAASKELRRFEGHQGPVWKAVFSADGKRVLSGSGFPNGDSTLRLWDVETGRELRKFGGDVTNFVFGVALSHDGKQALSGNKDGLRLWDVETGAVVRRMDFEGTNKTVLTVALSSDGKRAVSGGSDRVVRLWDLASGSQIRAFTGHLGRVMSVAFSPDGSQIASCGLDEDKTVRLWNTETGNENLRLEGHTVGVESVAFTPDGSRLISGAFDGLILWDLKAGKLIRKIDGDGTDILEAIVFPDGRRVLSGTYSGRVSIWNLETGLEINRLAEGSEWVWTVAVSPDGLRGVSAGGSSYVNGKWVDGKDFAIRLWSLPAKAALANPVQAEATPMKK
ncbi:MAG: SUMF1/EgtB/PvdO family nonheme iron enzyme [Planctomycetaceae bacterium]